MSGSKYSRMSAGVRSAWPLTRTARFFAASAEWVSTRSQLDGTIAQAHRRDQSHDLFDRRQFAACELADDLDIAPDGRVFFSEATIRYEIHEWLVDAWKVRGNGRIICYDPNTRTTRHDVARPVVSQRHMHGARRPVVPVRRNLGMPGQPLYASTDRRAERSKPVIPILPGYPDNINRASDGTYWLALVGMRTPIARCGVENARLSGGAWRCASRRTNGCFRTSIPAASFVSIRPAVCSKRMWDLGGENHPMITSMREHKGYLYIGGIFNNRIGQYKIPGADPNWTGPSSYWGSRSVIGALSRAFDRFRGSGEAAVLPFRRWMEPSVPITSWRRLLPFSKSQHPTTSPPMVGAFYSAAEVRCSNSRVPYRLPRPDSRLRTPRHCRQCSSDWRACDRSSQR